MLDIQGDRIVGVSPDKLHPTNKGVQCIKGLNAHEPTYRDRLTKVLVRKDMSDPGRGKVSALMGNVRIIVPAGMAVEIAGTGRVELIPWPPARKRIDIGDA